MSETINLARQIEQSLPQELTVVVRQAAELATRRRQELFLVGGVVRDLLLAQTGIAFDLDLVATGDAIALAQQLAEATGGALTVHPMFNTAKIKLAGWTVDVTMVRTETYARPGALPVVLPGTLETDLFRRDFTINAMAVRLNADRYGAVVDSYGGLDDLRHKLVRVLHEKSFTDDATRIWRAIRYEQRLGFQIEPVTLQWLKRDVPMLKTVGGYRVFHELEMVLQEREPEKALVRVVELGVLAEVNPALKIDDWLVELFRKARDFSRSYVPAANTINMARPTRAYPGLYLALLTYRLGEDELKELVKYLKLDTALVRILRETRNLIKESPRAGWNELALGHYSKTARWALLISGVPLALRQTLERSLEEPLTASQSA